MIHIDNNCKSRQLTKTVTAGMLNYAIKKKFMSSISFYPQTGPVTAGETEATISLTMRKEHQTLKVCN